MCAEFSACVALGWCLCTYPEVHPYEASCRDYSCNQMWKCGFFPSPSWGNCHSFHDMHYASQALNRSRLKRKSLTKRPLNLLACHLVASRTCCQYSCTILSSHAKPLLKTSSEKNSPMISPGFRCFIKSPKFGSTCILFKTAWNIHKKTQKNVWPNYLSNSIYFKWRSWGPRLCENGLKNIKTS